jgi:putative ABC transport system permease protein
MTAAGRRWRRLRRLWAGPAGPGPAWALAAIALLAALVAAGGPRETTALQTRALRQALAATAPPSLAVTASTSWPINGPLTAAQLAIITNVIGAGLRPPLASPPGQRWSGLTTAPVPVSGAAPAAVAVGPPKMEISYRSGLAGHARLVSGSYPDTAATTRLPGGRRTVTLAVAATQATAARFGLRSGSRLDLGVVGGGGTHVVLKVTGILRPVGLSSAFWANDSLMAAPALGANPTIWDGAVFVGPAELATLEGAYAPTVTQLNWEFPLRPGGLTAAQETLVAGLLTTLEGGGTGNAAMVAARANFEDPPAISSGLLDLLSGLLAAQSAVRATDSLLTVGLLAVALILLLVCALVLADAYTDEMALLRARGGSTGQVAARVLGRTVAVAGPALAAGALLAVLAVPGGANRSSWLLTGVACAIALAGPPLITAWKHRGPQPPAGTGRADLVIPRRSPRRLVAEGTMLAVLAGGVAALRLGASDAGGLYASSVPVLVAVTAGLVVARVYPLPLRVVQRFTAARRGTVS